MAKSSHITQHFGGLEISPNGYINAGNNTIQNVKNPNNNKDAVNKEYVNRFNNVGDIKMSIRNSDFSGWLKCDGRSVSRTTYSELFSIISTSFGNVDGNTFNLPDCRGRVIGTLGEGSGLTNRILGTSIGEEKHTLTTNELPQHSHSITDLGHTHNTTDNGHVHTGTTASSGSHTHTSNANGGQGGLGLVTANGSNTETSTDSSAGELNLWTTPYSLTIDSAGSHTHTFTSGSSTTSLSVNSNTTGISVNNAGGGQPLNIIQPTIFLSHVYIYSGIEL